MKPFRRIVLFASAGVLTLAGCAPLIAPESRTTNYACADGKGFRLLSAGDAATIEIDGMSFRLEEEQGAPGETNYSCSMLRLTKRGDVAQVEMDGRAHRERCIEIR
jgi:hypothetical protein